MGRKFDNWWTDKSHMNIIDVFSNHLCRDGENSQYKSIKSKDTDQRLRTIVKLIESKPMSKNKAREMRIVNYENFRFRTREIGTVEYLKFWIFEQCPNNSRPSHNVILRNDIFVLSHFFHIFGFCLEFSIVRVTCATVMSNVQWTDVNSAVKSLFPQFLFLVCLDQWNVSIAVFTSCQK